MDTKEEALSLFKNNYNCCQAVIGALHSELKMDKNIALNMSAAFGGGMARQGRTCGAVVGAYMAMGMFNGNQNIKDNNELKATTYEMTQAFNVLFTKEHKHTLCKDLLGVDLSTDEGKKAANEQNLFETHCPKYVATAVDLMKGLMANK